MFATRVPREAASLIQERADELDVSYSEYIAYILCKEHGVNVPAPGEGAAAQERLPLTG